MLIVVDEAWRNGLAAHDEDAGKSGRSFGVDLTFSGQVALIDSRLGSVAKDDWEGMALMLIAALALTLALAARACVGDVLACCLAAMATATRDRASLRSQRHVVPGDEVELRLLDGEPGCPSVSNAATGRWSRGVDSEMPVNVDWSGIMIR